MTFIFDAGNAFGIGIIFTPPNNVLVHPTLNLIFGPLRVTIQWGL